MRTICNVVLTALALISTSSGGQLIRLYAFTGGADGKTPSARLAVDGAGNLLGVTAGGGVGYGIVFRLTPPLVAGSPWTETVLHTFAGGAADGKYPFGDVILDSQGNLYGTATGGGLSTCDVSGTNSCGIVFRISPNLEYTILYQFGSVPQDGWYRVGKLAMDASGALFGATIFGGTASNGGTAFKLTPPAAPEGNWTESLIHIFGSGTGGLSPYGGVTCNSAGALFGTTRNGGTFNAGTVFELDPPTATKDRWTGSVLHSFSGETGGYNPVSGIAFDSAGALYSTTLFSAGAVADGTVFKLNPPTEGSGRWIGTFIHEFGGTNGASPFRSTPAFDLSGNLWVTTESGGTFNAGTLVELAPPIATGLPWATVGLYSFSNGWNGAYPTEGVTIGPNGAIYGTTAGGGNNNSGIVYQFKP